MSRASRTLVVCTAAILTGSVASGQPEPAPPPEPPAPAPASTAGCGAAPDHSRSAEELAQLSLQELLATPTTVASTQERSVFTTPSTVAVIDRDTIRRYDFRTVAEAVNTIAGFATVRTSSRTNLPTSRWVLQAHYPNKILVMINGVPTWKPVTGETTLGHIDIHQVERIEVLRGPSSVLYGTNAYAGAINIVLRCQPAPDTVSGSLYGGAGTEYAVHGGGHVALREGPLSLFVAASGHDEYGDQREVVDAEGVDGWYRDFRNWSDVVATARYRQHALLFNRYRELQTKLGKDPDFADGWGEPENLDGLLVNYTFDDQLTDRAALRAGLTFDSNRRVFAREDGYDLRTTVVGHRSSAFARALIGAADWLDAEVGADVDYRTSVEYRSWHEQTNQTIDESNLRDRSVYEASAYGQLELRRDRLALLGGARLTYNQLFHANLSSRATGVYAFNPHNSLKLIVGQSYRAPSLFELYFLNPGRTLSGNPELAPETSTSFELAFLTSVGDVFVQALAYYARYDGTIHRQRVPAGTVLVDGQPSTSDSAQLHVNGSLFDAAGVELEYKAAFGPVSSFGTYTFVYGDHIGHTASDCAATDYYNFAFVPQHKVVLGASVGAGGAYASLAGVYLSDMCGADPARVTANDIFAGQLKLDATVGYDQVVAGHGLHHVLSAKNLADKETVYPEYVDRAMEVIPYDQTRRVLYTLTIDF